MDDETCGSLREILEYLHDDEKKDWLASGKSDGHLYCDIVKVFKWLDPDQ
jgi:hypothetical protein